MWAFLRRHAWPLGILAGALALRLVLFTGLQGNDDTIYSREAYRIASGDLAPRPDVFWMRLGYVAPIAAIYAVAGVHILGLVLLNLASSLGLVFLAYRLGRELYTEATARTAAVFVALLPLDVFHATESHADLPHAVLGTLSLVLLRGAIRAGPGPGSGRRAILAGLLLGWSHLCKESAFLFLLPMAAWAPDRRSWPHLARTAAAFVAVLAAEAILYAAAFGDPLARVRVAQGTQAGLMTNEAGLPDRAAELVDALFNPLGVKFASTGGLFWLSAAGCVWGWLRERPSSRWLVAWWLVGLLALAFWPRSLFPYRPVMNLHPRVLAPTVVPAALLGARFLVGALGGWKPAAGWAAGGCAAALALLGALRIHQDARLFRVGVEWARERLRSHPGATVVTDPRTAAMLEFMEAYRPPYAPRGYAADLPPPAAGTVLLDEEFRVRIHASWGEGSPPAWWRTADPPREILAQMELPPTWRVRGAPRPGHRVVLSRISGPP